MSTTDRSIHAQTLRKQFSELLQARRIDDALATLETLVRDVPEDVAAGLELATMLYNRGEIQASSAPLLQATRHLPRNAPLLLQLVHNLIVRGEIVAARQCLDFLSQAPEPPTGLLKSLANLRYSLGEIDQARLFQERALKAGADDPLDHHMYAMLLQFVGNIDGAIGELQGCLERWPDFGDAIVPLVGMRKQTGDSNDLAFIEEQLQQLPPEDNDPHRMFNRAQFEFARFQSLDKMHRHEEAWPSLERCNTLMHKLNPYDTEAEAALVDALLTTPGLTDSHETAKPDFEGPVPIFIVGMPRSGTTLLDRMLSAHSRVASAGEMIEFWRQLHWVANEKPAKTHSLRRIIGHHADIDFRKLGARYLEQSQWRAGNADFYIDKLPANIQMVAFIRRALPHAPILHMTREPMDVCFSNLKAFFGNGMSPHSYDMQALAHYYLGYKRLADHWRERIPDAMLDIPYASMVSDPQATMREVLAHCGLEDEDTCLHPERNNAPVATPSSAQVREPIHARSIGEWKHYAAHLEPLRKALG